MKVLLDTHALFWWLTNPHRLRKQTLEILSDPDTAILVSAISAYELAYKSHCGKLKLPHGLLNNFSSVLKAECWTELPLTVEHSLLAAQIATSHRDPFDRLLGAQAIVEKAHFVTVDPAFKSFPELLILW